MKRLSIALIASILVLGHTMHKAQAAKSCYKARIIYPGTFMGNDNELIELFDGSQYVIKYAMENMNLQQPMATICPKNHLLIVKGVKFYVQHGY